MRRDIEGMTQLSFHEVLGMSPPPPLPSLQDKALGFSYSLLGFEFDQTMEAEKEKNTHYPGQY